MDAFSHGPWWYITPEKGHNKHLQLPAQKPPLFPTEQMSHVFTVWDIFVISFKHCDPQPECAGMVKLPLSFSSALKARYPSICGSDTNNTFFLQKHRFSHCCNSSEFITLEI